MKDNTMTPIELDVITLTSSWLSCLGSCNKYNVNHVGTLLFEIYKESDGDNLHLNIAGEIKKLKNQNKTAEICFEELLVKSLYLEKDFAQNLQVYDMLDANCFMPKDETAKSLIKMISGKIDGSIKFIVTGRRFVDKTLSFDFEICQEGYEYLAISHYKKNM